MNNYNEKETILMLQDPSTQRKAFERIVKAYSEQLYWQIRRMVVSHDDANDLLQNTGEMPSFPRGSIASPSTNA